MLQKVATRAVDTEWLLRHITQGRDHFQDGLLLPKLPTLLVITFPEWMLLTILLLGDLKLALLLSTTRLRRASKRAPA